MGGGEVKDGQIQVDRCGGGSMGVGGGGSEGGREGGWEIEGVRVRGVVSRVGVRGGGGGGLV